MAMAFGYTHKPPRPEQEMFLRSTTHSRNGNLLHSYWKWLSAKWVNQLFRVGHVKKKLCKRFPEGNQSSYSSGCWILQQTHSSAGRSNPRSDGFSIPFAGSISHHPGWKKLEISPTSRPSHPSAIHFLGSFASCARGTSARHLGLLFDETSPQQNNYRDSTI